MPACAVRENGRTVTDMFAPTCDPTFASTLAVAADRLVTGWDGELDPITEALGDCDLNWAYGQLAPVAVALYDRFHTPGMASSAGTLALHTTELFWGDDFGCADPQLEFVFRLIDAGLVATQTEIAAIEEMGPVTLCVRLAQAVLAMSVLASVGDRTAGDNRPAGDALRAVARIGGAADADATYTILAA